MRSNQLRIAVASVALLVAFVAAAPPARAYSEVSFEFFHSSLSPHGGWYASSSYGQVWHPYRVQAGWHPYSHGHWVYTDFGWTWASSYSWGAIPFHYGTWVIEPGLGWVWVPGYVWAPAWVVYRTGPSYIGWAPVAPSFSFGVSFSNYDYYEPDHFVFVPDRHFCDRDVYRYAEPVGRRRGIYNNTTIIQNNITIDNDVVVNRGLDVGRVERVAARRPERMRIDDVPRVAPMERVSREQWRRNPREALRVDRSRFEGRPVSVVTEERGSGRDGRGRDAREARRRENTIEQAPPAAQNRESVDERGRNDREQVVREQDRSRDVVRVQEQREQRDRRERAVREDQERAAAESREREQQVRRDQEREHSRDLERQMRRERERAVREQAQELRHEQDRAQERARAMRDQEQQIRRDQERAMRAQEQQVRRDQDRAMRAQEQQVRREQRQEPPGQERRGQRRGQDPDEDAQIAPDDPGSHGRGRRS